MHRRVALAAAVLVLTLHAADALAHNPNQPIT
jgi:hypothetical protein